jgi:hypothetical protein
VSHHIYSNNKSYSTLKRLNYLYDTYSEMEFIQMMVKIFNLELKNDYSMALAYEIKVIMHDIDATRLKIELPLTTFIKALFPTYSHCLEYLQESSQKKSITFDKLVDKVAECEKSFGKKSTHSISETVCLAHKGKIQTHDSSRGEDNKT